VKHYSRTGEKSLTPKEYQKLLAVCNTLEEEVLLKVAVGLGIRRADVSKILIKNIDLTERKLTFLESKKSKRDKKTKEIIEPRYRTVSLGPDLSQLLRKYISTLPKSQSCLFKWGSGKYGDRTAHRRLWALCHRAEIREIPFHALRATCIKFKQAEGWSIEATAKLVGDTIVVVQEHYSTPSDAEMAELMNEKEGI
jgi:integrase